MNSKEWNKRIARRSDFTGKLVHLTKSNESVNGFENLFKILTEKNILGSTTESGFICGNIPAVCFQDMPLHSIAENIYYEQFLKKNQDREEYRYTGYGLRFSKEYIYQKGGRPVIYDRTQDAKSYLDKDNYWRIVNFDLSNKNNYIDWMHEREWRLPNNLDFELSAVEVLLHDEKGYKKFIKQCREISNPDILYEIKAIIVMPSLIF